MTTESTLVYTDDEQTAIAAVIDAGRASTKVLQSALGIGYRRASVLITELERRGVVGPDRGTRGREVLVDAIPQDDDDTPTPAYDPTGDPMPELQLLNPADLLVDKNIREAKLDPEFVASIRELGVLQPVVAVRTDDGMVRVRYGHRRTLAALEAGHPQIPVMVAGEDDADDLERIVRQWAENEHRAGLTTVERAQAIEQLSLLGVPADAIARRTHTPRADIDHALTVAASRAARDAVTRNQSLTLDQAAGLAEFEDDPDTAEKLLAILDDTDNPVDAAGEFTHELQYRRDQLAAGRADEQKRTDLSAAGVTILTEYAPYDGKKIRPLHNIKAADGGKLIEYVYDGDIGRNVEDPSPHERCPGHSAFVSNGGSVQWACNDWPGNGHRDPYAAGGKSGEVATTTDNRAEVIERNKQWKSATTVRQAFLVKLLASNPPPKSAAPYLALELAHGDVFRARDAMNGTPLTLQLLGVDMEQKRTGSNRDQLVELAERAPAGRDVMIALAIIVSYIEAGLGTHSWRTVNDTTKRYLDFLADDNGYPLADVEKLAAGHKLGRKRKAATS